MLGTEIYNINRRTAPIHLTVDSPYVAREGKTEREPTYLAGPSGRSTKSTPKKSHLPGLAKIFNFELYKKSPSVVIMGR